MVNIQKKCVLKRIRNYYNDIRINGHIGENWFSNYLRNSGYKVVKTTYYDYNKKIQVLNKKELKELLTNYRGKTKLINLISELVVGLPDYICRKNSKLFFTEVKTNRAKLNPHQKFVNGQLKKAGYDVYIKRLNVSYNIKNSSIPNKKFEVENSLLQYLKL